MPKTFSDYGIDVRGGSGNVKTLCPKCSHLRKSKTDPCLSVDVDRGLWKCHNCAWRGSLHTGEHDWRDENTWIRPDAELAPLPARNIFREAFHKREISDETIAKDRISFHTFRWNHKTGRVGPAIGFPYFRRNELINIKYRGAEKAFSLEAGCELIFWNLDSVVKDGKVQEMVVVTEGEADAMSVQEAGYEACISVPNGAPATNVKAFARHFDYIANSNYKLAGHEDGVLEEVKEFVIAVDNDAPGIVLRDELVRRFGPERSRIVTWPAGCKDANDVLRTYGGQEIVRCIEAAKAPPIAGIFTVEGAEALVRKLYKDGLPPGLSFGMQGLTDRRGKEIYTVAETMMTLITGIPGMGKSEFMEWIAVKLALEYGWKFAMFCPETMPVDYAISKVVAKYWNKPFGEGMGQRLTEDELDHGMKWANEHFFWILPEDDDFDLDAILKRTEVLIRRHGVNGLVIDPWNNIEVFLPHNMNEVQYLRKCLRQLKLFNLKHKIHTWVGVHPKQMIKDPKTGEYPIPGPYDLMGGSYWYNMADFILAFARNKLDDYDPSLIQCQKAKRRHLGMIGNGYLQFDHASGNFHDAPGRYANDDITKSEITVERAIERQRSWNDD